MIKDFAKYWQRGFDIHWTEMTSGGDCAAMERPELLSNDILKFFKELSND